LRCSSGFWSSCSPAAAARELSRRRRRRSSGSLPSTTTTTTAGPAGNAKAGAALFKAKGCDGCHTFAPAGSNATTGPDLDKLAQLAQKANRGSEEAFTHESIANPSAFVESGYQNIMPNFGQLLSQQQIADLVAYLTQG